MSSIAAAAERLAGMYENGEDPREIDLEKVVDLVLAQLPGVQCYVEQTGGGCATIYLGKPYMLDERDHILPAGTPYNDPRLCETPVPVMGGPGWFNGPAWSLGRGHRDDFSVGYDCTDSLADYGGEHTWEVEGPVEPHVAEVMVRLYREHPRVKRGEIT